MYIDFQENRVNRSVITVHTNLFAENRKLHKFAPTNSNFEKINYFRHVSSYTTCTLIFSKIGLVDQSKLCSQNYLQKIANCIILLLEFRKITPFGHALPPNGHACRF